MLADYYFFSSFSFGILLLSLSVKVYKERAFGFRGECRLFISYFFIFIFSVSTWRPHACMEGVDGMPSPLWCKQVFFIVAPSQLRSGFVFWYTFELPS